MIIWVEHMSYGCETGCCGHAIMVKDENGERQEGYELCDHPDGPSEEQAVEYARELVKEYFGDEHVKDLDWDRCVVVDD